MAPFRLMIWGAGFFTRKWLEVITTRDDVEVVFGADDEQPMIRIECDPLRVVLRPAEFEASRGLVEHVRHEGPRRRRDLDEKRQEDGPLAQEAKYSASCRAHEDTPSANWNVSMVIALVGHRMAHSPQRMHLSGS